MNRRQAFGFGFALGALVGTVAMTFLFTGRGPLSLRANEPAPDPKPGEWALYERQRALATTSTRSFETLEERRAVLFLRCDEPPTLGLDMALAQPTAKIRIDGAEWREQPFQVAVGRSTAQLAIEPEALTTSRVLEVDFGFGAARFELEGAKDLLPKLRELCEAH